VIPHSTNRTPYVYHSPSETLRVACFPAGVRRWYRFSNNQSLFGNDDFCPYFAPDPDTEIEELWHPEGGRYVDEELVIERATYLGEEIKQPPQRWTLEQQFELLDTHPMFTGKCLECGYIFDRDYTARVHWDCPECGWLDDSV
jgi:predicted  nucleic acid-binding Zn-ribbon protein